MLSSAELWFKSVTLHLGGIALAVVGFLGGMGLFAFQVYTWARAGEWWPVPLTDGILYLLAALFQAGAESVRPLAEWLLDPKDWIGLHKFLAFVPTSIALLGLGFLSIPTLALATEIEARRVEHRAARERAKAGYSTTR